MVDVSSFVREVLESVWSGTESEEGKKESCPCRPVEFYFSAPAHMLGSCRYTGLISTAAFNLNYKINLDLCLEG